MEEMFRLGDKIHYENLHLLKPHNLATKVQKIIYIQLLCNYPLGITTIVQLSLWKNEVLIINCHVKKLVSCITIASELKMGLLYDNLYTSYIHI
jgi:hypothetical protein